jgi:hypothetical protein
MSPSHACRTALALLLGASSSLLPLHSTTACAATRGGGAQGDYDRARISESEIVASTATTGLELVQRLRPQWLRTRGQDSLRNGSSLVVYVDARRVGGVNVLGQIPVKDMREVQYLDGREATMRFGTDHGAGVILVRTR